MVKDNQMTYLGSEISESEELELDAVIEYSLSLDPSVIAQRLSDDDRVRLERIEKRLFKDSRKN